MAIKCKICGFGENENGAGTCIKCGERLPEEDIMDITDDHHVNLKETSLGDLISFDRIKKKTRIINNNDHEITLDTNKAKSNANIFDKTTVPGMDSEVKDPVIPKTSNNIEKKKTLFVDEFNVKKENNLKFELIPLGEDANKPIRFYGENEVLSRKNISNDDYSISSNNHVGFEKTENGWKMKNLSSNGALFIRVEDEIEIKENDIIIIGKNKTFLFKPKN